jgi:hypothetical protein
LEDEIQSEVKSQRKARCCQWSQIYANNHYNGGKSVQNENQIDFYFNLVMRAIIMT